MNAGKIGVSNILVFVVDFIEAARFVGGRFSPGKSPLVAD
jgi:hypothetical protein